MSDAATNHQPRIFISYSHDSPAHCDRVLAFAQQLRVHGIDAELDQFHQNELQYWPAWCAQQLRPEVSNFVLCVCTPEYKRRIDNQVNADVGKGVFWEGRLIYSQIYNAKGNQRFVPVLIAPWMDDCIPEPLDGYTQFRLKTFQLRDGDVDYENLYRLLTNQPRVTPKPVGKIVKLLRRVGEMVSFSMRGLSLERSGSLNVPERKTDFMLLIEKIHQIHQKVGQIEQQTRETHEVAGETRRDIGTILENTSAILDSLRGKEPPVSTAERPHNLPPWMAPEIFIGRDKELRELCDGLCAKECQPLAIVQPQVVKGGGGIGKTRLAIQAAWVVYVEGKCDMAFYLPASTPRELDTGLAALAEASLLALYENSQPPTKLDARCRDVVAALRAKSGRWILLLDAADSPEARDAVNALLKELGGKRIMITSRREDWPVGTVHKLPLDVFTPDEAEACLRSRYWKPEPSAGELSGFSVWRMNSIAFLWRWHLPQAT